MYSMLYDETTFYQSFIRDLENCNKEVIIESPFITTERMKIFIPVFKNLLERKVKIYIMTRDPKEHGESMETQSESAIHLCEVMGIQVLICLGNHHRKLAILDREVLWEGSLNILSQTHSREIMRRMKNKELAIQMFEFLRLVRFI
jgi:hypothetical protein